MCVCVRVWEIEAMKTIIIINFNYYYASSNVALEEVNRSLNFIRSLFFIFVSDIPPPKKKPTRWWMWIWLASLWN